MNAKPENIARSTMVMAAGTLVSRILGFVRNASLTAAIGVTAMAANAFDVANNLPNFIYAILAGGVLNVVLVPQIVKAFKQGKSGKAFIDRLLTLGILILTGITLILVACSSLLVLLYTNGWSGQKKSLAIAFAYWCLPQVFFYGLYTLLGQLLNAQGKFGPYMWAPVVNNIVSIAGFGLFVYLFGTASNSGAEATIWGANKIALLAGTATLGVACQALVLIIPLRHFKYKPRFDFKNAGLSNAAKVSFWTFLTLLLDQIANLISYKMASGSQTAPNGNIHNASNASLTNAFMVYIIPHSLFTVSLTTALFTRMSKAVAENNKLKVKQDLSYGIRTTNAFTIFFSFFLVLTAYPVSRVLLPWISSQDVSSVSNAVIPLSLGLVPLGMTLIIKRVFYAFEDGKTVFFLQIPMSAIFICGSIFATKILTPCWWVCGIAAAYSLSFLFGSLVRLNSLRKLLGGIDGLVLIKMHSKAIFAGLIAFLVGFFISKISIFSGYSLSMHKCIIYIVVQFIIMILVYFGLLYILKVRELFSFGKQLISK